MMKLERSSQIDNLIVNSPDLKDNFVQFITEHSSVSFVNPYSYFRLVDSKVCLKKIDYLYIDGFLLQRMHNLFHGGRVNRYSFDFSSIAKNILDYCDSKCLKVAFVGSSVDEIDNAKVNLKSRYPNIIGDFRNGYFYNETQLEDYFLYLREFQPNLIVVGMGTPLQEKFISSYDRFEDGERKCALFTCGGFLTQTSEREDFYFPIVKKLGLRWLQRALYYKHVRSRLIKDYPAFIVRYLYCFLKNN